MTELEAKELLQGKWNRQPYQYGLELHESLIFIGNEYLLENNGVKSLAKDYSITIIQDTHASIILSLESTEYTVRFKGVELHLYGNTDKTFIREKQA